MTTQTDISQAGTSTPLLDMRGVSKVFANGVVAVGGFNLSINEGDFLSLLGTSGSGKSTVLRLIANLAQPTTGTLNWREQETARTEAGFVFQEPTLLPWASVFENVWLPLRLRGVSRGDAASAVHAMLDRVQLSEFANAVPRELSVGMKMRVSIARALITRPQLLLMDEPFAALDEITRFKLNNDLLDLWQTERFTAVFVTHSVFESVFLSNRVAVMSTRPGRIFDEVSIDAPYPRNELFRTSPEYAAVCRQTSDILARATDADASQPLVVANG